MFRWYDNWTKKFQEPWRSILLFGGFSVAAFIVGTLIVLAWG